MSKNCSGDPCEWLTYEDIRRILPDWDTQVAEAKAAGTQVCPGCEFKSYRTTNCCPKCGEFFPRPPPVTED